MIYTYSMIRRYIDHAIKREIRRFVKDAGVKGMKKGEHRMARDPEYVESLKGGRGNTRRSIQKPQRSNMAEKVKTAALVGGAAVGAGLLGRKLGKMSGFKAGKVEGIENSFKAFKKIRAQEGAERTAKRITRNNTRHAKLMQKLNKSKKARNALKQSQAQAPKRSKVRSFLQELDFARRARFSPLSSSKAQNASSYVRGY